jgi:hypothetical protein
MAFGVVVEAQERELVGVDVIRELKVGRQLVLVEGFQSLLVEIDAKRREITSGIRSRVGPDSAVKVVNIVAPDVAVILWLRMC